jgi:signal transduction histidine kinase
MVRSHSLVRRVARSAALASSLSALAAAVATSLVGGLLLQEAEDRRLFEAARDLEFLLGDDPLDADQIRAVVGHEHEETEHAGIRFTVSDAHGRFIAGEVDVQNVLRDQCSTRRAERLRTCSVATSSGTIVTATALHTPHTFLFSLATLVALVLSGLGTWFWSRPMARSAIAPFARLRARVATLDIDAGGKAELGAMENVIEVDELRATVGQLLERVGLALQQAHRFAANAAHELRTPLTALRAELELLSEHPSLPADARAGLSTAEAKVTDLVVLVEKLLVLAMLKNSDNEPTEIVSLRDVMEDVVRDLGPDAMSKVQLRDTDALVRGDATLLSSMFANALANALKFGDDVQVDLRVAGGIASITIDDDGPGLGEADWERVFEPFYRGTSALRRRQPGHGLGLALVRHIAQLHGGSAFFRRSAGTGARLEILIPELTESLDGAGANVTRLT